MQLTFLQKKSVAHVAGIYIACMRCKSRVQGFNDTYKLDGNYPSLAQDMYVV